MTHLSDIPQVLKSDKHKLRFQTATDLKTSYESSIKTVEISFYDHEIYASDKLIASITHDHSDFVTQPWVVIINDVEIHRANTWMRCYDYIIWHFKRGTLPKQQQEVEPVNTDNEQMAQIATECKKFGFYLWDDLGIYYKSVKLGEVGCTDGKWWVVRACLTGQLDRWYEENKNLGKAFDSSTGFILPNGATRSPDASWVSQKRWDALSAG